MNKEQVTQVAECEQNGVIGFINGTKGRDEKYKDFAEVWCIYMLKKYHGKKIGFHLLKSFFDIHSDLGFKKGYLWVLKNNPTIEFYLKTGGHFSGESSDEKIGKQSVVEDCYVWDNINLCSVPNS